MSFTPEIGMYQVRWPQEQTIFLAAKQSSCVQRPPMAQPRPLPHGAPGYSFPEPTVPADPFPMFPVSRDAESTGKMAVPAATSADGSDVFEPHLTASAARRLRRKRAAEHIRGDRRAKVTAGHRISMDEIRSELRRDPASGVECLKGEVWRLSRDAIGCRVVQEALELSSGVNDLAKELHGHVLEAVMCPHANYVVQKVVSHLSVAASSFVATELQGSAVRAAKHRFACRIFCRLLEFCGARASQLVDELLADGDENLCSHSFAHHVIESILEHGEERHKTLVAKILLSDLWRYATHKNSSYLIEKVICYCRPEDENQLFAQLGHPQALLDLAMTQYGSFVARVFLQDGRVNKEAALRHIADHQADVESTKHGRRFLADLGLGHLV